MHKLKCAKEFFRLVGAVRISFPFSNYLDVNFPEKLQFSYDRKSLTFKNVSKTSSYDKNSLEFKERLMRKHFLKTNLYSQPAMHAVLPLKTD
jgi:hypothetical protein